MEELGEKVGVKESFRRTLVRSWDWERGKYGRERLWTSAGVLRGES